MDEQFKLSGGAQYNEQDRVKDSQSRCEEKKLGEYESHCTIQCRNCEPAHLILTRTQSRCAALGNTVTVVGATAGWCVAKRPWHCDLFADVVGAGLAGQGCG